MCLPLDLHLTKEVNYIKLFKLQGKTSQATDYYHALLDTNTHIPEFLEKRLRWTWFSFNLQKLKVDTSNDTYINIQERQRKLRTCDCFMDTSGWVINGSAGFSVYIAVISAFKFEG